VALLAAARPESTDLKLERFDRLVVDPLGLSALDRILRDTLSIALPRPVLRRIESISGGNPLYALEVARALERRSEEEFIDAASVRLPETLMDAVGERIGALSEEARSALVVVAALSAPTRDPVAALVTAEALRRAEDEHVIVAMGDRIRLAHPLLGSVAYASRSPDERRALHRRLAELVDDPEERARHLANAAASPDEEIAGAVEEAAGRARARGAAESAAELAEMSVRLTPPSGREAALRRRALAGDCHFAAGDAHRADELLEDVVRDLPAGSARARILWRLAAVKASVEGPAAAFAVYQRALEEAGDDVRLQAQIHDRLATWRWIGQGSAVAEPHTRALLELAERIQEPGLLARALGAQLAIETAQGRGLDRERYERMLAFEREALHERGELPGSTLHHLLLTWAGLYEESRQRIALLLGRARERSDASQILPLWSLAFIDVMTSNWHETLAGCERGLELVEQVGRDALVPGFVALRSLALAFLGRRDAAEGDAARAIELAGRSGQEIHVLVARKALALLDLSRGDFSAAYAKFEEISKIVERRGDAGAVEWSLPDELEVRMTMGELDDIEMRLHAYEEDGRREALPRVLAGSMRVRALLTDAHGRTADAERLFAEALEHHRQFDDAYQLGRTLLALGTVQRRQRKKSDASRTLSAACERFEQVDARLWAERARIELGRVGGRPTRVGELTATERQIADLVASGKTNAAVAQALHVSPRTVEWNLSKIYRKVGVSSRTELAVRLANGANPRGSPGG
jgi:DNA-binding CsgD family transcriptional regulator